jgi:hypothetical protein
MDELGRGQRIARARRRHLDPGNVLGPAGAEGSESFGGGPAPFVSDGVVAGDGQAGDGRLARVVLGSASPPAPNSRRLPSGTSNKIQLTGRTH